jgi:hypothetical protein
MLATPAAAAAAVDAAAAAGSTDVAMDGVEPAVAACYAALARAYAGEDTSNAGMRAAVPAGHEWPLPAACSDPPHAAHMRATLASLVARSCDANPVYRALKLRPAPPAAGAVSGQWALSWLQLPPTGATGTVPAAAVAPGLQSPSLAAAGQAAAARPT